MLQHERDVKVLKSMTLNAGRMHGKSSCCNLLDDDGCAGRLSAYSGIHTACSASCKNATTMSKLQ